MKILTKHELSKFGKRAALVDTSLLLLIGEGVDVFEQLKDFGAVCVVPSSVLEELKRLAAERSKRGRSARLALSLIEKNCFLITDRIAKRADDDIVELALKYGLSVATADMGLRRRLLRKVPTIYYREAQRRLYSEDFFAY